MSFMQKQAQLGRELFEINTSTLRRLVELQLKGAQHYLETNQEFAKRLTEIRDVSTFVEMQREYGQTIWENTQENVRSGGEILKEAVEHTGDVLRTAFTSAAEEAAETAQAA